MQEGSDGHGEVWDFGSGAGVGTVARRRPVTDWPECMGFASAKQKSQQSFSGDADQPQSVVV